MGSQHAGWLTLVEPLGSSSPSRFLVDRVHLLGDLVPADRMWSRNSSCRRRSDCDHLNESMARPDRTGGVFALTVPDYRWHQLGEAEPAEAQALQVLRDLLPDSPTTQAWANVLRRPSTSVADSDDLPGVLHGLAYSIRVSLDSPWVQASSAAA